MDKGKHISNTWIDESFIASGQTFYRNALVRSVLAAIFLLQGVSFGMLAFFVRPQQSIVIVHYNVYFGVDIIGDWAQIFMVPSIALLFSLANIFLAQWFYNQKERFASYVLLLTATLVSIGSVIACASIAFINY